jgi:hypothetical protein
MSYHGNKLLNITLYLLDINNINLASLRTTEVGKTLPPDAKNFVIL